jgi:hypothetical protein
MLDYDSLASKPNMKRNIDGIEISYKDLLAKTLNDKGTDPYAQYALIRVTEDYIARPDLISFVIYGTDKYADAICKINGISNPFELNEDMFLLIPNLTEIRFLYQSKNASAQITSENDPISSSKKTFQKSKADRRRPSEQTIGNKNFVIDLSNKMIIY